MKAVIVRDFVAFDRAEVCDVADPVPGAGEVVIAVKVAEVNYPDILVIEGRYQVKPPLPFSPGKAGAGVVETVGAEVSGLRPGDRVSFQVEYGAYAEKVVAPARNCVALPDGLSFEQASALGLVYQTAYFSLIEHAGMRPGDSVLVLGASGGVGMASLQLAKALGAGLVIGGTRGDDKSVRVRQFGADHVLDLSAENLRDALRDKVRELTGGDGVDIVIDPVGGEATRAALRALAWRGRLVIVGFASGDIPAIGAGYLLIKNITVSGIQWSDYREREPDRVGQVQAKLFELFLAGAIKPHVSRSYPLEDYAQALARLKAGSVEGKIVLTTAPA